MRYLLLIGNGPVQNNTNYDNDIEDFAPSTGNTYKKNSLERKRHYSYIYS